MVLRPGLVALMICLLGASPARAADPDTGSCTDEDDAPRCTFAYGKVEFVADGDTIDVALPDVGVRRVRLTGVNAMEQTRYSATASRRRGACHALAATARVERLLRKGRGRVRLAAQDPTSMAGRRLRRQVSTRIAGSWVDVGRVLLEEGRALWLPNGIEYAWNRSYRQLSQQAAARRLRLFDTEACGRADAPDVDPELQLNWDARGNDALNVNGESAEIRNPSSQALDLSGWWFRDSSARRLTFPAGAVVAPGEGVTVHVGRGNDDADDFFWGLPGPAFENVTGGRRAMGDGAYLFDSRGNLRASVIYPESGDAWSGWRPRTIVNAALAIVVLCALGAAVVRQRR